MGKVEEYRQALQELLDSEPFLLEHSGLPGPRGNLELAAAVAEEADKRPREHGPPRAGQGTFGSAQEFLSFCGVIGLGRLLAGGDRGPRADCVASPVILAGGFVRLSRSGCSGFGDADFAGLLAEMGRWAEGTARERRAAVAALCGPRLLSDAVRVREVLGLTERVTAALPTLGDRGRDEFRTLRKTRGYAWSVVVLALPERGKPRFERLLDSDDADVCWIVRENLRKKRLERIDRDWVNRSLTRAQRH